MFKCIVVDDEKPARDELKYLIEQSNSFCVIDSAESGKQLFQSHYLDEAEVIFLDINMPTMSGIEVAQKLLGSKKHIIFVTAYDEYAIKAFEFNAVDYILKPVSENRLIQCLDRLEGHFSDRYDSKLEKLFKELSQKPIETISIHYHGKILPIRVDTLVYLKAENKGVVFYTTAGTYQTNHKLKDLELKLMGTNMFRCHRSFMINIKYIEHIEPWFNRTYNVSLSKVEEKIPISRHYVNDFNKKMNIM